MDTAAPGAGSSRDDADYPCLSAVLEYYEFVLVRSPGSESGPGDTVTVRAGDGGCMLLRVGPGDGPPNVYCQWFPAYGS